jgi:hypothetical protein
MRFLPEDGQSLWDITSEYEHRHYIDTQKFTPGLVAPIIGEEGASSRHPLLTMLEGVRFTGEEAKIARRIYVLATGLEAFTFPQIAARVKDDAAWEYHEADCGHDVMNGQREQVVKILLGPNYQRNSIQTAPHWDRAQRSGAGQSPRRNCADNRNSPPPALRPSHHGLGSAAPHDAARP